eukprot:TRINITY_DN46358_c0_g1_i1.p1 TRINITY_DN46358_c0_g1~~TRINITY_DN46358_c0_g1_i1.p1  ORF type:complete len:202 (-),score=57.48 TRINITY_DN46358_c0_g1_i1:95-700(-)
MRVWSLLLFLVLLVVVVEVNGRRGGGGRGGGGRGGGGGGSRTSSSRSRSTYTGGKKKSSIKSKLKKAAVIGAVAYGAYQIGKATTRFAHWSHQGWGFNDWNRWREQDGHLCRNNNDCNWLDRNLQCEDYELDFSVSRAWYGGDFAAIVGECECQGGMVWDDRELQCQEPSFGGAMVALIICLVLGVMCCCCCGAAWWFCRR